MDSTEESAARTNLCTSSYQWLCSLTGFHWLPASCLRRGSLVLFHSRPRLVISGASYNNMHWSGDDATDSKSSVYNIINSIVLQFAESFFIIFILNRANQPWKEEEAKNTTLDRTPTSFWRHSRHHAGFVLSPFIHWFNILLSPRWRLYLISNLFVCQQIDRRC